MENEFYFNKSCWVCLAEESDMSSIFDEAKLSSNYKTAKILLCDVLSSITSKEVLFEKGPRLICGNCKLQAYNAYKFKKRCEISLQVFKRCGLRISEKEIFCTELKNNLTKEVIVNNKDDASLKPKTEVEDVNNKIDTACNRVAHEEVEIDDDKSTINIIEETQDLSTLDSSNASIKIKNLSDSIIDTESTSLQPSALSDSKRLKINKVEKSYSKTFLCTICGSYKSKNYRKQHMEMHANVRKQVCPFCDKRFNDKGNLNVHIRIHTGVHPYVCDICGKTFVQSTGLKAHKRVHDNERPYKCHICTYSTRTSGHLQLHIKRHIGVRNHHCNQCNYSACSKAELTCHLLKHTDEKNHVCKTCGKGFSRRKSLKTHEKSHTGEKPHICELCGKGFTQAHSLRSHLRTIHQSISTSSNPTLLPGV